MSSSITDRVTVQSDAAWSISQVFGEYGAVRVARAHTPAWLERARTQVKEQARLVGYAGQPDKNLFDLRLRGVLGQPEAHMADSWFPTLQSLIGDDCIVGRVACCAIGQCEPLGPLVRSLFEPSVPSAAVPCYALALIRPLAESCRIELIGRDEPVDVEVSAVEVTAGAALIGDARHRFRLVGEPGGHAIVSVYQRHWFRNTKAGHDQIPLKLKRRDYARFSGEYQKLFAWCFDRYASYRRKRALARLAHRVIPPALINRIRDRG